MNRIGSDEARRLFAEVFASRDAAHHRFVPEITSRAMIFPVQELSVTQLEALGTLAARRGEDRFVFSWTEVEGGDNLLVPFDERQLFFELPKFGRHALFSPVGTWGIAVSDEDFAVVGSRDNLAEEWLNAIGADIEEMNRMFIDRVRNLEDIGGDTSWARPLLDHIYGTGFAADVL